MKGMLAALCCLMLASSQIALAQSKSTENKPPLTKKEEEEKRKAVHAQFSICFSRAEQKKLERNSKEHHQFMGQCLSEKK